MDAKVAFYPEVVDLRLVARTALIGEAEAISLVANQISGDISARRACFTRSTGALW